MIMCALLRSLRICVLNFKFWIDSAIISEHLSIWVKQKLQGWFSVTALSLKVTASICSRDYKCDYDRYKVGTEIAGFKWS